MGGGFKTRKIPRELIIDPPPRRRHRMMWLFLLLVAVATASFALRALADPLDAGTGELLFKGGNGSALLLNTDYETLVNGLVASTTLSQRFENTSQEWREAVYVFPLPATAALQAMQLRLGDRVIRAVIEPRQAARKLYIAARNAGKAAALTEQQRPNLFTQSVANIAPGATVNVTIRFVQVVDYRDGHFQLRLPLTLTPRYIPGRPDDSEVPASTPTGWGQPTDEVPDAPLITPYMTPTGSHEASVRVVLNAGTPLQAVDSPFHRIKTRSAGNRRIVTLANDRIPMDRDFVLRWRPTSSSKPRAAFFGEHMEGSDYGLLMVMPPTADHVVSLLREFVFVIDISGSMKGVSIRQAKGALEDALARLDPDDLFDVIAFNSRCYSLFGAPRYASETDIAAGNGYVDGLTAEGGTEMSCALEKALAQPVPDGYLKQIIFITDGAVGNEARLFRTIIEGIGPSRLFTVGIGSAPNSFFMRKAAQFGRGTFINIGATSEVRQKISALFNKIETPVSRSISIDWQGSGHVETFPARIPALYAGDPLIFLVRSNYLQGAVQVRGRERYTDWEQTVPVRIDDKVKGVDALWARDKISDLLDEKVLGADSADIEAQVTRLGLTHNLVTPYTSFVAVEQYPTRPPGNHVTRNAIPNEVAKGQAVASIMIARTGTHSRLALLLGAIALMLAGSIQWLGSRRA